MRHAEFIRDELFLAPENEWQHVTLVWLIVGELPERERDFARSTITWANYPELTPEETASAALEGFMVSR